MSMQVIQFNRKKMVHKGNITWQDIEEGVDWTGKDLRFKLYQGKPGNPDSIDTLIFDIDHLSDKYDDQILEIVSNLFPYQSYIMYTGGGYHIYLPLEEGFAQEEVPMALESYHEQCEKLNEELEHVVEGEEFEVDHHVLTAGRYGRVPGSTNSKNGETVRFVGTVTGDTLPDMTDLLQYREVAKVEKIHTPVIGETTEKWEDSILYNNCAMSRWVTDNINDIPYEVWKLFLCTLAARKERNYATQVAQNYEKYGPEEEDNIDKFFDSEIKRPLCRTFANHCKECDTCPHNLKANTPINVTGPAPTPSRDKGFHRLDDEGNLDYTRVNTDDIISEYTNLHSDLFKMTKTLYVYNGNYYKKEADNVSDYGLYSKDLKDRLNAIPKRGVYHHLDRAKFGNILHTSAYVPLRGTEAMDSEDWIGFSNGYLNVSTGEFTRPTPEVILTSLVNYDLDEDMDCSEVHDWFKSVLLSDEATELLQTFFGLTISNVRNVDYQQFLWLVGTPGAGKSTCLRLLNDITDKAVINYSNTAVFKVRGDGFPVSFLGKKLFCVDELNVEKRTRKEVEEIISFLNPIISGHPMQCKLPYEAVVEAEPKTTVIITSNDMPPQTSSEDGLKRRLRVVHFPVELTDEQKKFMFQKNNNEIMKKVVAWAVQGLRKSLKRQQETGSYTPGRTGFELSLHKTRNSGKTFDDFLSERIQLSRRSRGSTLESIGRAYRKWTMNAPGVDVISDSAIQRAVIGHISKMYQLPYERIVTVRDGRTIIKYVEER